MTICWNCKSDIGDLYKICPICHMMLEEIECYKCGSNKTDICKEKGHLFGKHLWIESENEDEDGNWDGTYLCNICWKMIYDHKLNPCCKCWETESKLDMFGKPIWYKHYNKNGEWDEKFICYYCYVKENPDNIGNIKELIVRDCIREFGFNEEKADRLRSILVARINRRLA